MKAHHNVVQRSDVWFRLRAGLFTASHSHEMLARGRDQRDSVMRARLLRQIVVEILTGVPQERRISTGPMRRGIANEPAAIAAYAARTGHDVRTVGLVVHDELRAGCSLDGYVGDFEGVVEVKAPNTATHLRYLMTRRVPTAYRSQITHQLWITGAQWCDFVSFDDRLSSRMQLLVVRVRRQDVDVAAYDRAARQFLGEVQHQVDTLAGLGPVDFFRAAPIDIARHVLSLSVSAVNARKHEPPAPLVAPAPRPPLLEFA